MNPCTICGNRILVYPGTCDECKARRKAKFQNEWAPSYDAHTASKEPSKTNGFGTDFAGNQDKLLSKKERKEKTRRS